MSNEWISLDTNPPVSTGVYLGCSVLEGRSYPEDFFDALYHFNSEAIEGESKWQHSSGFYDNGLTHWMPLKVPSPPDTGEK